MNLLPPLMALALLLPGPLANAADRTWTLLVVDKDPKGTNVRDAPSGNVIKVLPFKRNTIRMVEASEETDGWFRVDAMGTDGWMHGSVLGICAEATEDGDPGLNRAPTWDSRPVAIIRPGSPVRPIGMKDEWLKVRDPASRKGFSDGWLPEQALTAGEGAWEECARAWARRK